MTRTQVGIVGAGPAGLTLGHLLHRAGIDSVILESRSRAHVESRIRAGVLEHDVVELYEDAGVGERLRREGLVHTGVALQAGGERHRIDFEELTGRTIVVYGQTEVVKDLIEARLASGRPLVFEAEDVTLHDLDGERPRDPLRARRGRAGTRVRRRRRLRRLPRRVAVEHPRRRAPDVRAGVPLRLARDPRHGRPVERRADLRAPRAGFALLSMRSPELSRLYLQCAPDEDLGAWSDERIWEELQARLGVDGWTLTEGPIVEKGVTSMRSFVVEPMQWGRLHLAGDAAHIVPPTGAKGLNLAVRDVKVLAEAIVEWYRSGDRSAARRVFGDVPETRLARRALLVVDDDHAPPEPARRRIRPPAPAVAAPVPANLAGRGDDARRELRRGR